MPALNSFRQMARPGLIAVMCAVLLGAPGFSQDAPPRPQLGDAVQIVSPKAAIEVIERTAKVVEFKDWLTRVDGFDPKVISVIALDKNKLRVQGLEQGVTTMVVTDKNDQVHTVEVFVMGDARLLQSVLNRAFPNSAIQATMLRGNAVLLRGWVTDAQQISSITELAQLYSPNVVNQIRVGGPQEVQLRVKVLEVQRSKLRQFGINFAVLGKSAAVASTPGPITPLTALTAPIGGIPSVSVAPTSSAPPSLGIGVTGSSFGFEGFVQALKTEGLLKIQAEPVLVTRSGEAAQLDNGGEFPIPVPQSLGTVTIEWREYGVILQALPIVISPTRLRQQVYAEVSEKDVANQITLNGTTVPGITRRRVQSTVEMEFGQTLVLGGLITTRVQSTVQRTPFLGELPGIGAAFSTKQENTSEVELIIMITPEYVNALTYDQIPNAYPGRASSLPTDRELYLHGYMEVPRYGPDSYSPIGGCDPSVSVQAGSGVPWVGGGQNLPATNGMTTPSGAPTSTPPMPSNSPPPPPVPAGDGLIAPPAARPGNLVPPPPTGADGSSVRRSAATPATVKNSKSIPSRYAVKQKPPIEAPVQAGYKTTDKLTDNEVVPASAKKSSDSKSIPNARFE